jgi:hypothetical protein
MYRRTMYFGRKAVGITAMAAVDMALWDLKGKAFGQPIHRLLGGKQHAKIRGYASILFGRDGKETRGARIRGAVKRMAVAGKRPPRSAVFLNGGTRRGGKVGAVRPFAQAYEEAAGVLGAAQDHRAAAEDAGRDRALHSFRSGRIGHARGLHARHQPMLGDRHQAGVEHACLGLARRRAGYQQPEVLRERELAHEVAAQIVPAHHDRLGIGRADRAGALLARSDLHA